MPVLVMSASPANSSKIRGAGKSGRQWTVGFGAATGVRKSVRSVRSRLSRGIGFRAVTCRSAGFRIEFALPDNGGCAPFGACAWAEGSETDFRTISNG